VFHAQRFRSRGSQGLSAPRSCVDGKKFLANTVFLLTVLHVCGADFLSSSLLTSRTCAEQLCAHSKETSRRTWIFLSTLTLLSLLLILHSRYKGDNNYRVTPVSSLGVRSVPVLGGRWEAWKERALPIVVHPNWTVENASPSHALNFQRLSLTRE